MHYFVFHTSVSQAYVNQCQLDTEMKQLQVQAARFSKITNQWMVELCAFQNALKVRYKKACDG